jgi:hypothetical protein
VHLPVLGFGQTQRNDAWWVGPFTTVAVLLAFIVYATFRMFENRYYEVGAYLSPLYSPLIDTSFAAHWPIPLSPAMLILGGPLSFRFTCYYYRKAYYRSFAMDPPACAVGERNAARYNGETRLLLFQNLHRFALYVAIGFIVFLTIDVVKSFHWPDGIHMGLGTVIMAANIGFLGGYTFGCHSFRHLIGGSVNSYSTASLGGLRHALWKLVSRLNARHQLFAWSSLFAVGLTDLYIRMVASGAIHDLRIF